MTEVLEEGEGIEGTRIPRFGVNVCISNRYPDCIFTRDEAEGAIPNGTHIRKTNSEVGDRTPDGTIGVVIGSLYADASVDSEVRAKLPLPHRNADYAYFVEWQSNKEQVVGVLSTKIERSE